MTASNRDLATQARQLADTAPRGSLRRRGLLCAAVALDESRDLDAARKLLGLLRMAEVRREALAVLDHLDTPDPAGDAL